MKRERGPAAASHRAFGKKYAREVDQQRPRCGARLVDRLA